jgi:hypothetical protein
LKKDNAHIPTFMQRFSATRQISRVITGERHANLSLDSLYLRILSLSRITPSTAGRFGRGKAEIVGSVAITIEN